MVANVQRITTNSGRTTMTATTPELAPQDAAAGPPHLARSRPLLRCEPDPTGFERVCRLPPRLPELVREWHRLARVRGGCRGCRWLPGTSGAWS